MRRGDSGVWDHLKPADAARLGSKLKRHGILNAAEVNLLCKATLGFLRRNFGNGLLSGRAVEDSVRFEALAKQCAARREAKGLTVSEVSAMLKIPRYRILAVEKGSLRELDAKVLARYVAHLGLERWYQRWARENAELVTRVGLAPPGVGRPNKRIWTPPSREKSRR